MDDVYCSGNQHHEMTITRYTIIRYNEGVQLR